MLTLKLFCRNRHKPAALAQGVGELVFKDAC